MVMKMVSLLLRKIKYLLFIYYCLTFKMFRNLMEREWNICDWTLQTVLVVWIFFLLRRDKVQNWYWIQKRWTFDYVWLIRYIMTCCWETLNATCLDLKLKLIFKYNLSKTKYQHNALNGPKVKVLMFHLSIHFVPLIRDPVMETAV